MSIVLIVKMVGVVIQVVRILEPLFPGGGKGGIKKSIAMKVVARFKAALEGGIKRDEWMPLISGIIDDVVSEFNADAAGWVDPDADANVVVVTVPKDKP